MASVRGVVDSVNSHVWVASTSVKYSVAVTSRVGSCWESAAAYAKSCGW